MKVPNTAESKFLKFDGVKIHYLEAGHSSQPTLVLLHSSEFGASAELSWEFNIPVLSQHFHILAPDWLGNGYSDKVYDFGTGPVERRLQTLRRFLEILCVDDADFIGNSGGASLLLQVTAEAGADYRDVLPIRKQILISPSVIGTPGPGRKILNEYDGTRDSMRKIISTLFFSETWHKDEEYLDRRQESGMLPGHWESLAAARLKMPGRPSSGFKNPDWENCVAPTLFITGRDDNLIEDPDGGIGNVKGVKSAQFHVFEEAGHCAHIEHPDEFHEIALQFLKS